MSEVVNLNRFRKRKARASAEKQAAENRAKFGRSKAQKQADEAAALEAQRRLDQLKRELESIDP